MPELVLKLGDQVVQRFVVDKDIISIGRSRDNDVMVENLSVSRNHGRIRRQGGKFVLTDLNSANGTFVNGVRVSKTEIVDGDVVSIGKHKIEFVNKPLSDSDVIVEAFGADRTMVIDKAPVGMLCVTEGKLRGKEFSLTKFETTIGKASANDIVIADDWFLSRKQAVISRRGNEFEIKDLGGFRKTRVNGTPLSEPLPLKPGDILEFGNTRCVFQLTAGPVSEAATGRIPKELGLEDSVFASVSELPPDALEQVATPPVEPAEVVVDVVEDWSSFEAGASGESAPPFAPGELEPVEVAAAAEPAAPPPAPPHHKSSKRKKRDRDREFGTQRFASDDKPAMEGGGAGEKPEGQEDALQTVPPEETPTSTLGVEVNAPVSRGSIDEIALWEQALENRSPVIRRQAARNLKKLTGKDHAY